MVDEHGKFLDWDNNPASLRDDSENIFWLSVGGWYDGL